MPTEIKYNGKTIASIKNGEIATLKCADMPMQTDVEVSTETDEVYEGEYAIVPSAEGDVVLDTSDKTLSEDITIKKIPYAEVSNNTGGTTITIGE